MKNPASEPSAPQKALLFIPDITGFTKFVTDTEINHAQHIIQELLEILMDANNLGLEVSEVEGDAILFYRFGKAPTAQEMTGQVKEMFSRFHMHLKKYETHRVCNCGACCTASKLAIKFVAHYGEITVNQIRQYKKLFGKEVIVVHRLLKNNIDASEYSLFTDNLINACHTWQSLDKAAWAQPVVDEQEYDSGRIKFTYLPMDPIRKTIPEPETVAYGIHGKLAKVIETEFMLDAPLETVFNVIADVAWRAKWLPGVLPEFTDMNTQLTQTGQTHKCLANKPVIISHDYSVSDHIVTFFETMADKKYSVLYTLTRLDNGRTQFKAAGFIKKNPIVETIFRLFMRKKMVKVYNEAWTNLSNYINDLKAKGIEHPYKIQLRPASVLQAA